ncbi:MAG: hypothetical protein E7438_08405 [Ruminococcaceae bacterium]|nr:hypothetical protein [Oscillospiraceae bacterium]
MKQQRRDVQEFSNNVKRSSIFLFILCGLFFVIGVIFMIFDIGEGVAGVVFLSFCPLFLIMALLNLWSLHNAKLFFEIAIEKGYTDIKYLKEAYVNPAIGFGLIIAMPDLKLRSAIEAQTVCENKKSAPQKTEASLEKKQCGGSVVAKKESVNNAPQPASVKLANSFEETYWVCGKCKTKNLNSRDTCWSCGNPK